MNYQLGEHNHQFGVLGEELLRLPDSVIVVLSLPLVIVLLVWYSRVKQSW